MQDPSAGGCRIWAGSKQVGTEVSDLALPKRARPRIRSVIPVNCFVDDCILVKQAFKMPRPTLDYSLYLVTGRELLPPGKVRR